MGLVLSYALLSSAILIALPSLPSLHCPSFLNCLLLPAFHQIRPGSACLPPLQISAPLPSASASCLYLHGLTVTSHPTEYLLGGNFFAQSQPVGLSSSIPLFLIKFDHEPWSDKAALPRHSPRTVLYPDPLCTRKISASPPKLPLASASCLCLHGLRTRKFSAPPA